MKKNSGKKSRATVPLSCRLLNESWNNLIFLKYVIRVYTVLGHITYTYTQPLHNIIQHNLSEICCTSHP
jgi:hypothetical protein